MIGTGHEAEQKIFQLLQTGAKLKLISDIRPAYVDKFVKDENFIFERKTFSESDLENIWLVVSTLPDRDINEQIYKAATSKKILCNVVDVTGLCSFIFPAVVTRGDINIAISTSGTSPALAQNIKGKISDSIGPEYGLLAGILGRRRKEILNKIPFKKERTKLFYQLVNSGAIELLRQHRNNEAELLISNIIEEELKDIIIEGTI
jgi:precorrin-2 dehydrogenase/sirohydrochlorin ferrochelatase